MLTTRPEFRTILAIMAAVPALVGCGAAQGTQPEDMSAEEHRATADEHDEHADAHEGEYDPNARDTRARAGAYEFAEELYNPTQLHANAAVREHELADRHRHAAEALESFEAQECGSFPPATRAVCPLLGQLSAVEDVEGGARLTFTDSVNGDAVYAHVRCHVAFAGTQGREGMGHCPMYVEGVTVERDESGAMLMRAEENAAVAAIRARARAHLTE